MRRLLSAALVALASARAPAAKITEYPLSAGTGPYTLTLGPDGNIWIAEWGANKIARLSNAGALTEVDAYTPSGVCNPFGITAGLDGTLWFTCTTSGRVNQISTYGSSQISYGTQSPPTGQIAVGSDGKFWYAAGAVGVYLLDWAGGIDTAVASNPAGKVSGVAPGPHGQTWFLEWQHGGIALFDGSGAGSTLSSFGVNQNSFVVQCRGHGWVAMTDANQIRRVEPTPLGLTSWHDYPLAGVANSPTGIACGLDGSVWFSLYAANKIARLKNDGSDTYEEFPIPTASSGPWGVAIGSDGSVWFAESSVHKVGRLQLRPTGDVNGDGQVNVSDVFYLINFLFAGGAAPVPQ